MTKASSSATAEELADQEVEEQEDDEGDLDDDSAAQEGAGAGAGAKKKKKKKNKKKKKAGAAENGEPGSGTAHTTPLNAPKVDKAEADRRFNAALAAIKSEELWIELGASSLQDSKLKKLLDQLKKTDSVTSLNLSQNHLSDDSAQALAAMLGASTSLPGLITLDLRENSFTPQGLTILEGLKKVRRNLNVQTGPIEVPKPPSPPATGAGGGAGKGGAAAGDKSPLRDLSDSRLVRKYFQIGNEEEEDSRLEGNAASDPGIEPDELWQQLDQAVAQGAQGIPAQQSLLRQLCAQLGSELGGVLPGEYDGSPSSASACPHVKACLDHLPTLNTILGIVPPSVTVQYSSQAQPAVGSHRVLVGEAVAHLVSARSAQVDARLAASQLVPRVLHLAVAHPLCSALQARALALLRDGVSSGEDALLVPLAKQPGWGLGLPLPPPESATAGIPGRGKGCAEGDQGGAEQQQQGQQGGSAPPAGGQENGHGAGEQELCPPLPALLASRAQAALGVVGGLRSPLVGFAIQACRLLRDAAEASERPDEPDSDDEDEEDEEDEEGKAGGAAAARRARGKCNAALKAALDADAAWREFAAKADGGAAGGDPPGGPAAAGASGGALARLCAEQEGDLGGPRAQRTGNLDGGDHLAELAGGGLITGSEILALLQGMSMGSR